MSELGDQIFSKITNSKDLLTNLGSKIPGFSGYIERQERRNSDKLLRETIAARFDEQRRRVTELQNEFISEGELTYLDDLEKAALRLQTFADRIKTAARGYSGFFDAVKINEEELLKLLQYDNALLAKSEDVARAIDHVQASIGTDGLKASIRNLQAVAQDCIDAFNKREEILLTE
jgi:hypothetical protein